MWFINGLCAFATISLLQQTRAVGTDDRIYAKLNYGSFQNPSSIVRPRFRYWANDASLNLSRVANDVRDVGKSGGGGVELLGYYLYGDSQAFGGGNAAPLQADWTMYGWGLPPWSESINLDAVNRSL